MVQPKNRRIATEAYADAAVESSPKISTLENNQWVKAADSTTDNLNNYTEIGKRPVTRTGVLNRPVASAGDIEVFLVGSTLFQIWSTTDALPLQFIRSRNNGVWSAWSTTVWRAGSISASSSLNDYASPGVYNVGNAGTGGKPTTGTGILEVFPVGNTILQRFTSLDAVQEIHLRSRGSGVWSPWRSQNYYRGYAIQGTDFDTYTLPNKYSITFLDHPHQPVNLGGELEVSIVSSGVVQEFMPLEENPRVFRRQKVGSAWSEWIIREFQAIKTGPTRSAIRTWSPQITDASSAEIITEYTKDRTVGFNGNHSTGRLMETRNEGATWTELHQFPNNFIWVRVLDNGELLACTKVDPDPRDIWLSSGYGTDTVTWSKVLTGSAPYVTFGTAWGFSSYKNIVLIAEYGPKLPLWNGKAVTENARYVYMSLDHGKTWATVFDLNNYLLNQMGRTDVQGQHLHGVAWDQYWDRIWVTFGDDTNGTVYSDNLGATWHTANDGVTAQAPNQNVGILPMPKCILFGTDVAPNGVQRINRSEGKRFGTYPIEQAYTIDGDDGTTRTHLCQAIRKVERAGDDGPALFGFGSETNPAPSFIVGTYDGYEFTKIWQDTIDQAAGMGIRTIAGPSLRGALTVGSNDQRVSNRWSKLTGPIGIY